MKTDAGSNSHIDSPSMMTQVDRTKLQMMAFLLALIASNVVKSFSSFAVSLCSYAELAITPHLVSPASVEVAIASNSVMFDVDMLFVRHPVRDICVC